MIVENTQNLKNNNMEHRMNVLFEKKKKAF
jgi:hypothetical protein